MSATMKSKARSMFDLQSLPHHLSITTKAPPTGGHVTQQAPPPEVTGVSPREGVANGSTRVVIRGSSLGQSRDDIVRLTVAGLDCLPTLDYDSSTRVTCLVGPAHLAPGHAHAGDVIVETRSGGVGISLVQFRFVDAAAAADDDQFAAVPYDGGETPQAGESPRTGPSSLLHRMTSTPAAGPGLSLSFQVEV